MKALILALLIVFLVPRAGATEFDDIMNQLDEGETVEVNLDEWAEDDTDIPQDAEYEPAEDADPTADDEPAADAEPADELPAEGDELPAEGEELPAAETDEPTVLAVLTGILFFMGITTGVILIKMLFDRVRAV